MIGVVIFSFENEKIHASIESKREPTIEITVDPTIDPLAGYVYAIDGRASQVNTKSSR
jgi:hypothetical protein